MAVRIATTCFPPYNDAWIANWAAASPAERSERYENARRLGLVTDREPDFNSSVAPVVFWPPGHPCMAYNAPGAGQGDVGYPDEGDRRRTALGAVLNTPEGDFWRNPLGLGGLDPRRLLERAQEALGSLAEWVQRQVRNLADTLARTLGLGKWAIIAALAILLGVGYFVFDRIFPAAPRARAR